MISITKAISIIELWSTCSDFVQEMCKDRDVSHGYKHMKKVALSSMFICNSEFEKDPKMFTVEEQTRILKECIVVGWLHDVADHKYDHDGLLKIKVDEFLEEICGNYKEISTIIDYISFSKENKAIIDGKHGEYFRGFSKIGLSVRNVVSDADKLEALGKTGFKRMKMYKEHAYREAYNEEIPYEILKSRMWQHFYEKLNRLPDEFIRTKTAKLLAIPRSKALLDEMSKL